MGIEKLSDFVYSKTKRNKSLNKGGPTIMKKKKLISLLLVASMAFSLAACGSSGGDDKDADKGGDEKKFAQHSRNLTKALRLNLQSTKSSKM